MAAQIRAVSAASTFKPSPLRFHTAELEPRQGLADREERRSRLLSPNSGLGEVVSGAPFVRFTGGGQVKRAVSELQDLGEERYVNVVAEWGRVRDPQYVQSSNGCNNRCSIHWAIRWSRARRARIRSAQSNSSRSSLCAWQ